MAQRFQQLIRLLNRQTVEQELLSLARERLEGKTLADRELSHLVTILTNPALLVSNLYDLLRLADLNSLGGLPNAGLRFWKTLHEEEPEVIHRVLQAPDTMRAVGDKCLFDHATAAPTTGPDVNLEAIGSQAYESASQVLEYLADDRRLRQYYEANRFRHSSLDEEIAFYHRCAGKFGLYGDLLRDFVSASVEARENAEEGGKGGSAPPAPESRANTLARPRIDIGETRNDPQPDDGHAGDLAQLLASSAAGDLNAYLSGLERWALFSTLNVEQIRSRLDHLIVNQPAAINRLCDDLCLFGTGTADPRRPTSYFLIGPTGVGKNYLVEQMVEGFRHLWDIEVPFLLIEGPQFTYPSDINELKGAARGFIRSDEEGIMTEFHKKSKEAPLAIVLIDEIEKAHPQLRRFFLSVMDRGTMTDNRGKTLNFANTMFFYTSNVGYSDVSRQTQPIGYGDNSHKERRVWQNIEQEIRKQLSPEFMNRVTLLHFNYLRRRDAERIFELEFAKIAARYEEHQGIKIRCTQEAKERIMEMGFDREYGARNLATVLNRIINIGISRQLRADDARSTRKVEPVLESIRTAREGAEPVDLHALEKEVASVSRARVLYKEIEVDIDRDGDEADFVYIPR